MEAQTKQQQLIDAIQRTTGDIEILYGSNDIIEQIKTPVDIPQHLFVDIYNAIMSKGYPCYIITDTQQVLRATYAGNATRNNNPCVIIDIAQITPTTDANTPRIECGLYATDKERKEQPAYKEVEKTTLYI